MRYSKGAYLQIREGFEPSTHSLTILLLYPSELTDHMTGARIAVIPTASAQKPFYSCDAFRYCLNRVHAFIHPLLQFACRLENKSKCHSYAEGSHFDTHNVTLLLSVQGVRPFC